MNDWAEEGGNREKEIEDKGKELEALRARMKENRKETLVATAAGVVEGLGISLIIFGTIRAFPSVLLWIGSILALIGVLWIIQICRRAE